MRLPKIVNICGKTYTVKQAKDKNGWSGSGKTGHQEITISLDRYHSEERKFDVYLHEVVEMICCERHVRYEASDGGLVFVMTHKEFDDFAADVATAIRPMIKD